MRRPLNTTRILAYGESVVARQSSFLFLFTPFSLLARTADNAAVLTISVTQKIGRQCAVLFFGGAKRIRTAGLLVANEALYQLSHNPKHIF